MNHENTYYWLNPSRLPVMESIGLILVLFYLVAAFSQNKPLPYSFPHWDGITISLPHAQIEIQTAETSELFIP